jgi:hypothetical protein
LPVINNPQCPLLGPLQLGWSDDAAISLNLDGKYPCLRIAAEAEKGFRDRHLPIAPDFANLLDQTPSVERVGKVFEVAKLEFRLDTVSKVVSRIDEAAGGVANRELDKFASAHDLRRIRKSLGFPGDAGRAEAADAS